MTVDTGSSPAWLRQLRRYWGLLLVLAIVGLMAAVRIRLRDLPLERDEGEYAYAGQLILEGIPPYQQAYNMKFPGTYAAYALIMAVFGQSPAGIHLGLTGVVSLTSLMLWWLGRKLLDEVAGVVAVMAYTALAAAPNLWGFAGHATHFAAFFATAGLCLLATTRSGASSTRAAAAGLMFGMAMLMKQHAAFLCAGGAMFLATAPIREKECIWRKRVRSVAAFCIGVILPLALTCLILWRVGVFEKFWFCTIVYAREYVSQVPLRLAPANLGDAFRQIMNPGAALWAIAAAGVVMIWFDARLLGMRLALVGLLLTAFLATCPGFMFRQHYFLLTLPVVALLAGCAVSAACCLHRRRNAATRPRWWPLCGFLVAWAVHAAENRDFWFKLNPIQASRVAYGSNPFPEAESVAAFIRINSTPDARVVVLGSEPEIYFLSRRRAATGYIYVYPLMELQPFAAKMQQEMIREVESNQPEFVVVVKVPVSWLQRPGSDTTLLDWWNNSFHTHYHVKKVARLPSPYQKHELVLLRREMSVQ